MNLDTKLKRALYNSPFHHTGGKIALAAILIGMFVYAIPNFQNYYLAQPLQMLAGLAATLILYLPTLLVLYFLDRREREPKLFFYGAVLAIIFFFGPVASRTLHLIRDLTGLSDWQFVGFVEEPTKVLPLILLLIFARPTINGVRDGLIYGALGGLGFAMLEGAAYFALVDYPDMGWNALFTETIGRATLLGTDIHILFAATVGAGIGYAVSAEKRWKGILVGLGIFLLVALTHGQQDFILGKTFGVYGTLASSYIVSGLAGLPLEQLDQLQGTPLYYFTLSLGSTIAMLAINLINLVILYVALRKSGEGERQVIRDQLKDEVGGAVNSEEYEGILADRRYRTRKIKGMPRSVGNTIVQLQNELAFHKEFVAQRGEEPDTDPPVVALRELIEAERAKAAPTRTVL